MKYNILMWEIEIHPELGYTIRCSIPHFYMWMLQGPERMDSLWKSNILLNYYTANTPFKNRVRNTSDFKNYLYNYNEI